MTRMELLNVKLQRMLNINRQKADRVMKICAETFVETIHEKYEEENNAQ